MNPGSRLVNLTAAFKLVDRNASMMSGWISILKLEGEQSHEYAVDAMQVALQEVRLWESRLVEVSVPTELYSATGNALRKSFSATHANGSVSDLLAAPFESGHQQTLKWSAWVLREFDEQGVDEAEFRALDAALAELDVQLNDPNVPDSLRRVLERQAQSLRTAVRLYNIAGASPLRQAVSSAVGELVTLNSNTKLAPESRGVLEKSFAVLSKAGEICEKASAAMDVGEKLYSISKVVAPLLGFSSPP